LKTTPNILRLPAVRARTELFCSTIYLRIPEDSFPKLVSLGSRAVGWVEAEVLRIAEGSPRVRLFTSQQTTWLRSLSMRAIWSRWPMPCRKAYPYLPMIVCTDDDASTEGNPGLAKANSAALATRAQVAVPD